MSSYSNMPFMRFALGVAVAGIPLLVIGANRKWANAYILLLVLGFVTFNWQSLGRASAYVQGQLRTGVK